LAFFASGLAFVCSLGPGNPGSKSGGTSRLDAMAQEPDQSLPQHVALTCCLVHCGLERSFEGPTLRVPRNYCPGLKVEFNSHAQH